MKALDKKRYERFMRFLDDAKDAAIPMAHESEVEQSERVDGLKKDYGKFFAYYLPRFAKSETADFHKLLAKKVLKNNQVRAVFEAFRGSAKSVHSTIGLPLYLMAHGEMRCMILVSDNEDKAIVLLDGIRAQLEANERLRQDYGFTKAPGKWEDNAFSITDRDGLVYSFYAIGLGQSPRGTRKNEIRPDYIVVDDADTKERCKNPKRVREAVEWITDDLLGTFDAGNQRFILCNNRINKTSILTGFLKALSQSPNLFHLQVNALDNKGLPSWPEKYTPQYWADKMKELPLRSFQREYMNNPIEEGTVFRADWVIFKKFKHSSAPVVYVDPSFKSGPRADYKAIAVIDKEGPLFRVLDCFVRQTSVKEMVSWLYDLYATYPDARYFIEANFIQDILMTEFVAEGEKRGFQLPIRPDRRKKPDKFMRVEAISPFFERGLIVFDRKLEHTADGMRAVEQLMGFEKGSRMPDDFPDALEGAIWQANHADVIARAGAPILIPRKNSKRW